MISALGWMRRSAAATAPARHRLTEADYEKFMATAAEQLDRAKEEARLRGIDLSERAYVHDEDDSNSNNSSDDEDAEDVEMGDARQTAAAAAKDASSNAHAQTPPPSDDLSKYNLDDYDNDDDNNSNNNNNNEASVGLQVDAVFTPLHELIHPDASSDDDADAAMQDSDEEDDLTLRPTDALFVAARTEDEVPQLEVYVFEQDPVDGDNFYVHHDLMLGSFPLCLEWLSHPCGGPERTGTNFVAVGTFEPEIEIWNLDVIDAVCPDITLAGGHVDAVMSLAWNRGAQNFLCSGGADRRILLWDLNVAAAAQGGKATAPLRSFNHARDKVQSLAWNPVSPSLLASAAYDRVPCVFDLRAPDHSLIRLPKLAADPEQLKWHSEHGCAVADESGRVSFFDTRSPGQPTLILDAHSKAVTCLDFCPVQAGSGSQNSIFLTASADKSIKVWGRDAASGLVQELCSKTVAEVGKVFAAGFLPDAPLVIAAGGSRGVVETWNLRNEDVVLNFLK